MDGPLLAGKVRPPARRRGAVARPRLGELLGDRLGGIVGSALTLVSAPAGFGKTTLLAEWLAGRPDADPAGDGVRVAWLSLDANDNDPTLFWRYVVAALQAAVDDVGAGASALLQAAQPSIEAALVSLVNDVQSAAHEVVLVLDDYHLVETAGVHDGMAFLLAHRPPRLHLVIATRADPPWALARIRARGELLEIRAADLRFTSEESAAYLSGTVGLALTAHDMAVLDRRTEGWIAALQLAAVSLQGRTDVSGFIAGFAGDDRYVVDYLVEEVLARQPPAVRDFLLQTSVLDRLTGPLCDAVTGRSGSAAELAALERANLFLIPLDDRRRWYRYHQLFADVLQTHLAEQHPDDVQDLHRRACDWFDRAGDLPAAVRHALAAGDLERAAELVERAVPDLRRDRQEATIRGWLGSFPEDVLRARPVLAMGFVGALMAGNEFDDVERRLRDVEQVLGSSPPAEISAVDDGELSRMPAAIEMYRAALALGRGDVPGTMEHARIATGRAAPDDHLIRAAASALSGLAAWSSGDLDAAHGAYSASVDGLLRAGHVSDVLGCTITLADIRITQGRLGDARRACEEALQHAAADPAMRGIADMHVALAQIASERGETVTARGHLLRARELGEHTWLPQNPYRWRVAMARVHEMDGDLDGALDMLDEAHRVYVGDFSPDVRPVAATRTRVLVARGRLGEAWAWARFRGLAADDDLSYLREYEHITLAGVLLARSRAQQTEPPEEFLRRLLAAAEAGQRTGSVIEILVLQALAHRDRGDAMAALERALALAEPEDYVRVFVGEGPPMISLLRRVPKQHAMSDYARRLVAAGTPTDQNGGRALVDPLSERESAVLRLLGTDLDGPAIARELSVSLNTLRTHTQHVYTKLGVSSRRTAVQRAAELGLLPRTRGR